MESLKKQVLFRTNFPETRIKIIPPALDLTFFEREMSQKEAREKLNLPFSKVKTNMDRYANTSGGTIPIILDETLRNNELEKGDLLLFAAVGAGWTWGTALYKW